MSAKTRRTAGGTNRRRFLGQAGAAGAAAGALAHIAAPLARGQAARPINVIMSQEPPTLGTGLGATVVASIVKGALGNEPPLTQQNELTDWLPWVAKDVPSLENGLAQIVGEGADAHLQVVFELRDDVVWSDRTPLTAHDYVFGWELIMHPDFAVADRSFSSKISSLLADGDYRLIVRFMSEREARDAAANGRLLGGTHLPHYQQPASNYQTFVSQSGPVLDPNFYKNNYLGAPRHVLVPIVEQVGVVGIAQHAFSRNPLGIGPFRVSEWVPGQYIATTAVPTYFLGVPRAPGIVFRVVSDTNAVKAQLAAGQADVVTSDALNEFDAPDLLQMESRRLIRANFTPAASWEHLDLNLSNPHLADVRVRKALAHGINRQRIVDSVLSGKSVVMHTYAVPWRWDANFDTVKYDYNVQRARQLLEEAGYRRGADGVYAKDGRRLTLKWTTTTGNQMRLLTSQIGQQDLKEVGVDIQLEYLPASEFFAAGENPGPLTGRRFEIGHYAWSGSDDPGNVSGLYGTRGIPSRENGWVGQNFPGVSDPRLDELFRQADSSINQSARKQWYDEAQQIWAELIPVIPLFARANVTATKRQFQNFKGMPTLTPVTWNSYEWWIAD